MAYHTEGQVSVDVKVTFSASTKPTSAEVQRILLETDQEIDARIGVRYSVPVTNATDLILITRIARAITTERLRGIMQVITGNKAEGQSPLALSGTTAREMLDQIVDGTLVLLNTTKRNSHDMVKDYNYENDIEGSFKTDDEQW